MKILVSPRSLDEARQLVELGVDIIDVKNPAEGSLGAAVPAVVREITEFCRSRAVPTSAALGDLPFKPGTAALAAFGLAQLGVKFVKAGLYGPGTPDQAEELLQAVNDAVRMADQSISTVAAGYGDYGSMGGLPPRDLLRCAARTGCAAVMLDIADKRAGSLLDVLQESELRAFIDGARSRNLTVALAGSIGTGHLPALARLRPDIVGMRGSLCVAGDRRQPIDPAAAQRFMRAVPLAVRS